MVPNNPHILGLLIRGVNVISREILCLRNKKGRFEEKRVNNLVRFTVGLSSFMV